MYTPSGSGSRPLSDAHQSSGGRTHLNPPPPPPGKFLLLFRREGGRGGEKRPARGGHFLKTCSPRLCPVRAPPATRQWAGSPPPPPPGGPGGAGRGGGGAGGRGGRRGGGAAPPPGVDSRYGPAAAVARLQLAQPIGAIGPRRCLFRSLFHFSTIPLMTGKVSARQ